MRLEMTFLPAHVRAVEFVYGKVVEMLVLAEVLSDFLSQSCHRVCTRNTC